MTRHQTPVERVQATLTADFYADHTGHVATRRDILAALPAAPGAVWRLPRPVTLPRLPETWRAVQ